MDGWSSLWWVVSLSSFASLVLCIHSVLTHFFAFPLLGVGASLAGRSLACAGMTTHTRHVDGWKGERRGSSQAEKKDLLLCLC